MKKFLTKSVFNPQRFKVLKGTTTAWEKFSKLPEISSAKKPHSSP